jgi:Fe-S-cluster containining protein
MPKTLKKKESSSKCQDCSADCCHDLSFMITRPRTKNEKEMLKWHLHFDTVKVFIRNRRWYALIKGKCIYLGKGNKCTIYNKRSDICRGHMPPECEHYGKWYDKMISTPVELDKYLNGKTKTKRRID